MQAEATAKITGWLLVVLAIFISCQSLYTVFGKGPKPQRTYLGAALLLLSSRVDRDICTQRPVVQIDVYPLKATGKGA